MIQLNIKENLKKVEWSNGNCVLCDREAELADGYCVTCWDGLTFPGEGYTREPKSTRRYQKKTIKGRRWLKDNP